jgi:hypothetical protein
MLKNQFYAFIIRSNQPNACMNQKTKTSQFFKKKIALVYQSTRSNIPEDFKSLGTPQSDHQISHCRPTPLEAISTIFKVSCAAQFRNRPGCWPLALLDAEGERTTSLVASATVDQSTGNNIPEELIEHNFVIYL